MAYKLPLNINKILSSITGHLSLVTGHLSLVTRLLSLATCHLSLAFPALSWCQADLYSFPKVEDVRIHKPEKTRPAPPFVQAVCKILNVPEKILSDAVEKGFGRTELLRLILISQKSRKPLDDLIREREKGAWLSIITKSAGLDNKTVRREANALLPAIEQEEEKIKMSLSVSTVTAGVSDTLTKNATNYHSVEGSKKP